MNPPNELAHLGLLPHPEGGWYRETWRSEQLTAIDFVLASGTYSAWHRVRNRDEVWCHHRGGRVRLHLLDDAGHRAIELGGSRGHAVVPAGVWQAAELVDGPWGWVGCVVAPPFAFDAFELAGPSLVERFPAHAEVVRRLLPRA